MTTYVAGFMFRKHPTSQARQVALVLKQKPEFQKGKLNGIGGKVETFETPLYAMSREFEEETGWRTSDSDWREFCVLSGKDKSWAVHFFACKQGADVKLQTMEAEEIIWINLLDLEREMTYETLPNLRWLIPLALDEDEVFAAVIDPTEQ